MTDKNREKLMIILLFSVALVWGLGFVMTKIVLENIKPAMLNILRFSVASVIMFCLYYKKIIRLKWKEIGYGALTSVFMSLGFGLQTYGMLYTSPSNSALITGLNVVMVPFFAWIFYKKRPPVKAFISAFLAFISISLLSFRGFSKINFGDLLCFLCAVCFAIHFIILSKTSKLVDAHALAFLQMFFASIIFIIVGFAFDREALYTNTFNKSVIFPLIMLCLFSTCYAYIIQTNAQKYVAPSKASLILSTESLLGSVLSVIFKLETFSWYLAIAVVGVSVSLIIAEFPEKTIVLPSSDDIN